MFNNPLLLYWCWKDAEREVRRNPNNNDDNGFGGCLLIFVVIFIVCLFKAAFEVGGYAILFAFSILLGLIQGIFSSK